MVAGSRGVSERRGKVKVDWWQGAVRRWSCGGGGKVKGGNKIRVYLLKNLWDARERKREKSKRQANRIERTVGW